MYITPASIQPFQSTGVFPIGTMVIMEVYAVQQASSGGLAYDAAGHLIPGRLQAVLVKLKSGKGATPVPNSPDATVNQRGWVYASFDATTGAINGFDQPLCQSCHVRAEARDDLFTRPVVGIHPHQHAAVPGVPAFRTATLPGAKAVDTDTIDGYEQTRSNGVLVSGDGTCASATSVSCSSSILR